MKGINAHFKLEAKIMIFVFIGLLVLSFIAAILIPYIKNQ